MPSYNGSEKLEYNAYGNPKKWFKHGTNSSSLKYTINWLHTTNIESIYDEDTTALYCYSYNSQGIRVSKTANGIQHKYYLSGEQIVAETRTIGNVVNKLKYYYDALGICGFNYNGTDYYYQKNVQGDVLKIYDNNGNLFAEYTYDAWGKCTVKTNVNNIAEINPFKYRGYYLDNETNLYYLNSRYYDPEVGRFLSPDTIDYLTPESINGLNLYAYCNNNPVMNVDPTGHFVITAGMLITAAIVGAVVGGIVGGVFGGMTAAANEQNIVAGVICGFLGGAIMGAGAGIAGVFLGPVFAGATITWGTATGAAISAGAALAIGLGVSFLSGAIGGVVVDVATQLVNKGTVDDWESIGYSALQWGIINVLNTVASSFIESIFIAELGITFSIPASILNTFIMNIGFGSLGLIIDIIRAHPNSR